MKLGIWRKGQNRWAVELVWCLQAVCPNFKSYSGFKGSCAALVACRGLIRPYSTSNFTKVRLKLYYTMLAVHCVVQDNEEQLFGYEVTVQRKWLGSITGQLDLIPHKNSRKHTQFHFKQGHSKILLWSSSEMGNLKPPIPPTSRAGWNTYLLA